MEHKKFFTEDQLKFPIPSSIIVSGPSSSGKTELVLKLLRNKNFIFNPPPKSIGLFLNRLFN